MEQIKLDPSWLIDVDYEATQVPPLVRQFHPVVYADGDAYCCILGPDPQEGIFGCGSTPQQAISDWETHARERLSNADPKDKVAQELRDHLSTSKKDVW